MAPTTYDGLLQQMLGLFARAFNSMGAMLEFFFVGFLRVSPLPDEVDFLLVCLFIAGVITLIFRLFRGKQ